MCHQFWHDVQQPEPCRSRVYERLSQTHCGCVQFSLVSLLSVIISLATGTASGGGYVVSRYMQLYIYGFLIISHAVLNTLRLDLLGKVAWFAAWWEIIGQSQRQSSSACTLTGSVRLIMPFGSVCVNLM